MKNDSYQNFNVFGMLTIKRNHITGIASAISSVTHLSTEYKVNRDLTAPVEELVGDDDSVMLFVGIIEPGKRPQIAAQQFVKRQGGPDLLNHPVVQETLKELVNKF